MKLKILFLLILVTINSYTQIKNFSVQLNSIKVNNESVNLDKINELRIAKNDSLTISFSSTYKTKNEIFYRILVNGFIVEPKILDTIYIFKNLNIGVNLIKITAYIEKGDESETLTFPVKVEEQIRESRAEETNNFGTVENEFNISNYLLEILIVVIVIQLIVIFYLILKRSKTNGNEKKYKNEIDELKYSYKRAKEELKKQRDENENLKKQIKELDENVKTLEKTNVKLVEQKEKLAESKAKLEYLQTQKEEMFAIAIHDIKNPASAIKGYIELLNSYDLNAKEQQEIMESLVASSDDIVKLSQQMCTIIAKAMPEPKLKFVDASIDTIIESVYNQNTSYAKAKKVKLYNKASYGLPTIKIDPEKIEEALDNLVNNAIKYAPPDTIVEIKSYVKSGSKEMLVVEVKDTGYGLSEEDLKKSFQKGAILSNKPTGLEQSSGLGLWIVKRIIEEHNGKVWVESKLGVGSTFAFELPIE